MKVKVLFVTGTEDTSPEEPPIKPIWTTPIGVSNGPPLITRHPKRSHQHHLQVIKWPDCLIYAYEADTPIHRVFLLIFMLTDIL